MAPHSSTLAWKIPWTEEPGGLQSIVLQRVGHDNEGKMGAQRAFEAEEIACAKALGKRQYETFGHVRTFNISSTPGKSPKQLKIGLVLLSNVIISTSRQGLPGVNYPQLFKHKGL